MRLPAVTDATARSLVLMLSGALLLVIVPRNAFGTATLTEHLGLVGPTPAQLFGVALIVASWIYFLIAVVLFRLAHCVDSVCFAIVIVDGVSVILFLVFSLIGATAISVLCLAVALTAKVSVAVRLNRQLDPESRLGTSNGAEAATIVPWQKSGKS